MILNITKYFCDANFQEYFFLGSTSKSFRSSLFSQQLVEDTADPDNNKAIEFSNDELNVSLFCFVYTEKSDWDYAEFKFRWYKYVLKTFLAEFVLII